MFPSPTCSKPEANTFKSSQQLKKKKKKKSFVCA